MYLLSAEYVLLLLPLWQSVAHGNHSLTICQWTTCPLGLASNSYHNHSLIICQWTTHPLGLAPNSYCSSNGGFDTATAAQPPTMAWFKQRFDKLVCSILLSCLASWLNSTNPTHHCHVPLCAFKAHIIKSNTHTTTPRRLGAYLNLTNGVSHSLYKQIHHQSPPCTVLTTPRRVYLNLTNSVGTAGTAMAAHRWWHHHQQRQCECTGAAAATTALAQQQQYQHHQYQQHQQHRSSASSNGSSVNNNPKAFLKENNVSAFHCCAFVIKNLLPALWGQGLAHNLHRC